ncbi:MAG: MFS transporter [Candidatus Eremiobacteraeota bacterium]|nr:MFS transporter [Candidatus Eremiobacteraeota bacterium]MCW5865893.1 MFS transporter [Candidatus Eremiobacteraeota bacterium]
MSGYQWTVVFAAWLGWGFDIIDALLFNYVAAKCIPTLLHLKLGSPEAALATKQWVAGMASILLIGWAVGGIFFGWLADKIGRSRTLLLTIILYSLGTALCAAAPNVQFLVFCRILSSLGIGGEWAAGASMVSEVVPAEKRANAGALLYTSAPFGLVCAALINKLVTGIWLPDHPDYSWRVVFLFGLLPALAAAALRLVLKEPEAFNQEGDRNPQIGELFSPQLLPITRSGFLMALTALVSWWTLSTFQAPLSAALAEMHAKDLGLTGHETAALATSWQLLATVCFSLGGGIGTLLTVPFANRFGRKTMFGVYYSASVVAIMATFGLPLSPLWRIYMQFFLGLTVFGVFGSFTYYLPELFPTRLRATGSGFCYNVGRVITAFGPYLVSAVSKGGVDKMESTLFWVFLVPLFGVLALPWVIETKGYRPDAGTERASLQP